MDKDLIAMASISINAAPSKVWDALLDPEAIKQFMFDTDVVTDWKTGSPIVWRGEWQGNPYEDKGVVLTQDNNPTEEAREHSKKNWEQMLTALKEIVEQ